VYLVCRYGMYSSSRRGGEEFGAWEVGRNDVRVSDGVFHRAVHAFVFVFRVCDDITILGVWGLAATGGKYYALGV
jgi:hypothetical protein